MVSAGMACGLEGDFLPWGRLLRASLPSGAARLAGRDVPRGTPGPGLVRARAVSGLWGPGGEVAVVGGAAAARVSVLVFGRARAGPGSAKKPRGDEKKHNGIGVNLTVSSIRGRRPIGKRRQLGGPGSATARPAQNNNQAPPGGRGPRGPLGSVFVPPKSKALERSRFTNSEKNFTGRRRAAPGSRPCPKISAYRGLDMQGRIRPLTWRGAPKPRAGGASPLQDFVSGERGSCVLAYPKQHRSRARPFRGRTVPGGRAGDCGAAQRVLDIGAGPGGALFSGQQKAAWG